MTVIRAAQQSELSHLYEVFYHNEVRESPQPPALGAPPAYLHHVLETGMLSVASQDGAILAYAGAITRGSVTFLTDLFVHPAHQSGHLGKTLLHTVLPEDELVHCTVSSSDPRALALYIRAGMRPQWPSFALRLEQPAQKWPLPSQVEVIEADPQDAALVEWDARISGRPRPLDHAFWVREQRAVPLWFRRGDQTVGYGYIRLGAGTLWHPHACALGGYIPAGARERRRYRDREAYHLQEPYVQGDRFRCLTEPLGAAASSIWSAENPTVALVGAVHGRWLVLLPHHARPALLL